MKKIKSAILIALGTISFIATSSAQSKKTIYDISGQGLVGARQSILKSGIGISGSALWPLSPSFNLGASLSYQSISMKNSTVNFDPLSTTLGIMYFPEVLLKSIIKENNVLPGFYLRTDVGHHFSDNSFTNNNFVNNFSIGAGYLLPVGDNAINFYAGMKSFGANSVNSQAQQYNSDLYCISIGYSFIIKGK